MGSIAPFSYEKGVWWCVPSFLSFSTASCDKRRDFSCLIPTLSGASIPPCWLGGGGSEQLHSDKTINLFKSTRWAAKQHTPPDREYNTLQDINPYLLSPQTEQFNHRCHHDSFYVQKTAKGVDHPCYNCTTCVKNHLYDPDDRVVCSKWLKMIKENGDSAKKYGELWVKWNRFLVSIWKHNKVV